MPTRSNASAAPALDPATRIGHVHLTVANLDRQVTFYTHVLGFKLQSREDAEASLGAGSDVLLRLTEDKSARRVDRAAGMYHFAILYPSRKELARAIARLFALRYPNSPTDHGLSETTYLDDLEGNNIELYVRTLDRATYETVEGQLLVRYADGHVGSGRDPLDLESLFSELDETDHLDLPLPEATQIGHVHLYAASLDASMHFYSKVLGFQEGMTMRAFRMGDVGLDDRQPHVVAFNTWKGEGIPPAPSGTLGMRHFTIAVPNAAELARVLERARAAGLPTEETPEGILMRDPSGIAVILTARVLAVE